MPLSFVNTHVAPGEPVTAQAWNAIVDGLFDVQTVVSAGHGTARVTLTGDARDVAAAQVVAADAAGVRYAAVPPGAAAGPFVIPGLAAGAYTVTASAPGCTDASAPATVAPDGTVTPDPIPLALAFTGRRMPNVLGVKWPDAVGPLQPVAPRALDVAGKGVPLTGFNAAYADMPVLMQWPGPGEVVPAGVDPYVVVAASPQAAAIVTTPNIIGKTVAQAQAQLAALGLQLKVV